MPDAAVPPPADVALPAATVRFGRFELRPHEARLLDSGQPVALGGRAFDLLAALVANAGRLMAREELIERVWPGRVVEENNLSVQVNALRKALGGDVIVTVPGRGYRFAATVDTAPVAAEAARTPSPPRPPSHLPDVQPLLIGRSDDLAALGTLVEQHRLVTVVGAGGIGKTRLAQALLQLRASGYAQGVCWVALDAVDDAQALPGAVAGALGLRPAPGDAMGGLCRAAAGLDLLLALDNAEHLVAGVAALAAALLEAAPRLRLLVTSQAPLRLAAERVFRLGPLACPQGALPALEAQAFGAVALFAERARAADHRFVLTDAQVPAVVEICRRLDGLALAIELAAARAPLLGIGPLRDSLADALKLLGANRDRRAPLRQQTLRHALEWSHGLLGESEQRLFRRLAVLPAAAPLALLQGVAGDEPGAAGGLDGWGVLDALDVLVQRSLVDLELDADEQAPRYRLLASARLLALERLDASGEGDARRRRHAVAVHDRWQAAEDDLFAGRVGVDRWRDEGARELDHARAALAWAVDQGDEPLALALAALQLRRLPAALHDERLALADRCETLAARVGDLALRQRAWAAVSAGLASLRPQRSQAAGVEALALARRLAAAGGDRWPLYEALCEGADIVADGADAAGAEALLREARALEAPGWPPVRLRAAARVEAAIAAARGQAADALRLMRRLLALSVAAGDRSPMTRVNLADVELWAGDPAAAVRTGRALVADLQAERDESHLGYARINLAAALLALGDAAAARAELERAWPLACRIERQAWCADHLAQLAALEGRMSSSARLIGAADARYAARAEPRQINEARAHAATLERLRGELGEPALAALRAEGAALADDEVAATAFAR
jgi:predicted ATPase/DNA-binding winged helix-turn-helix (wHTH) protein